MATSDDRRSDEHRSDDRRRGDHNEDRPDLSEIEAILESAADDEDLEDLDDLDDLDDFGDAADLKGSGFQPVEVTAEGLKLNLDLGSGAGNAAANDAAAAAAAAAGAGSGADGTDAAAAAADERVDARPVTPEDLEALARVEAELAARLQETEIDPTRERIEMLLDMMGSPHKAAPSIQIAGTNGKSSTTRMIESLLRAFSRRTGRITSPRLQSITDTIAIDGEPIHPADFARIYDELAPFIAMVDQRAAEAGRPGMSSFEIQVAIAYLAFADAPVDVAVIETGMGGTWDATNVVNSDVAVIMPVGMDHADMLGDTLAKIAAQKAGIIKARDDADDVIAPRENIAIIAPQEPEARTAILQRAVDVEAAVAEYGSAMAVTSAAVAVGGQQLHLRGLGGDYEDIFIPLSGEHQALNAAVALAAVEAFFGVAPGSPLDIETVRRGFATATSPGRLERVRTTPPTFIDAAHNPHSARALAAAIERDFDFRRLIGIVGVLSDKDAPGILEALSAQLTEVVITQPRSPRAVDAYELAETARDIFGEERVYVEEELPSAYSLAVELAEDADIQSGSGVLITGSVVLAGQARTLFGKKPA